MRKKEKPRHWHKTKEESESCLRIARLLQGLLGSIASIQLQKLQQSLMTILRTQFPQKLKEGSCTNPDFLGGLQSENNIKINLFEVSTSFHYFVHSFSLCLSLSLSIYIYIYIYIGLVYLFNDITTIVS